MYEAFWVPIRALWPDMTDGCYVSSGAFKTRRVNDVVAASLAASLFHIELGSGLAWAEDLLACVWATNENPIRYLVHNYFPPHKEPFVLNLASEDPEMLRRSREHCRVAVDLSARLRAPFFSVHAGFAFSAKPEHLGQDLTCVPKVSLEKAHMIFVESLRELCVHGAAQGVKVLVENNVIAPFNLIDGQNRIGLCATAEDILQTYADVGSSSLGFLVDVGHLKVTANAMQFDLHTFLDSVAPHIQAFHLSDNDGVTDQNLPFGVGAWFLPRLAEFPKAVMILEAYRLEPHEIRACCEVIDRAHHRVQAI